MNALERAYRESKARLYAREDQRRTASYGRRLEPAADIFDFANPLLIAAEVNCWLVQVKEVSHGKH